MSGLNLVASMAGICTTVSFLPQVMKVHRTKRTEDLSLPMYVIFSCGVSLWTLYGVMIRSWPVMIANGITFILSVYILIMKVRHG